MFVKFVIRKYHTVLFAMALCSGSTAVAQTTVYTTPSGYVTVDMNPGFNIIGLNIHNPVLAKGTIQSESSGVITDSNATFDTILTDSSATYIFEITSGNQVGAVAEITAHAATTVTIASSGLDTSASYSIRKAKTLDEIFGTSLAGHDFGSGSVADVVWLPDGSGGYNRYFFHLTNQEFRSLGAVFASPPKPIPVFYPDGMIVKIAQTAKSLNIFGEIKPTSNAVQANNGFTLVSIPNPGTQTLADCKFEDFITHATNNFGSSSADIIWVPTTGGAYDRFFYNNAASRWTNLNSIFSTEDRGTTVLPSAIFIQNRSTSPKEGIVKLPPSFLSN